MMVFKTDAYPMKLNGHKLVVELLAYGGNDGKYCET